MIETLSLSEIERIQEAFDRVLPSSLLSVCVFICLVPTEHLLVQMPSLVLRDLR